jgi:hypothetical protein
MPRKRKATDAVPRSSKHRETLLEFTQIFGSEMTDKCQRCDNLSLRCIVASRSQRCSECQRSGQKCELPFDPDECRPSNFLEHCPPVDASLVKSTLDAYKKKRQELSETLSKLNRLSREMGFLEKKAEQLAEKGFAEEEAGARDETVTTSSVASPPDPFADLSSMDFASFLSIDIPPTVLDSSSNSQ